MKIVNTKILAGTVYNKKETIQKLVDNLQWISENDDNTKIGETRM